MCSLGSLTRPSACFGVPKNPDWPRVISEFSTFARQTGLAQLWDQYGAPDGCQRKGLSDYVCE